MAHGLIVRFWNRSAAAVAARLAFWQAPSYAARCRLDETVIEPLAIDADGALTLDAGPWQAVTVRVQMGGN